MPARWAYAATARTRSRRSEPRQYALARTCVDELLQFAGRVGALLCLCRAARAYLCLHPHAPVCCPRVPARASSPHGHERNPTTPRTHATTSCPGQHCRPCLHLVLPLSVLRVPPPDLVTRRVEEAAGRLDLAGKGHAATGRGGPG